MKETKLTSSGASKTSTLKPISDDKLSVQVKTSFKIGLIVPSSNITMEKELPVLLSAVESQTTLKFTTHSSRLRLKSVTKESLQEMNKNADKAVDELCDSKVDIILYACLVAVMTEGNGAHRQIQQNLNKQIHEKSLSLEVVTSAGAIIQTLQDLGAKRIAFMAPYTDALTKTVIAYIESEGIKVVSYVNFSITDNLTVGELDTNRLVDNLQYISRDIDALVLSCCVQMPSLDKIQEAENIIGLPVISAATATF